MMVIYAAMPTLPILTFLGAYKHAKGGVFSWLRPIGPTPGHDCEPSLLWRV